MEFSIKNIILYDEFGNVSGFAEFKIREGRTSVKVRYNDGGAGGLLFNVVAGSESVKTFGINGVQSLFEIPKRLDAESEIFVYVSKRELGETKTLASGVINEARVQKSRYGEEYYAKEPVTEQMQMQEPVVDKSHSESAKEVLVVKNEALTEVNEAIRNVCTIDENGKGQCETCPYREHFFGTGVLGEDEVVV